MAMENNAPLLELSSLIERPRITIDSASYEILSPEEISVVDTQRFAVWGRRIEALTQKDELSSDEEQRLGQLVADLTDRIMVGVPEDVRAKLADGHRLAVAAVFTQLLHDAMTPKVEETATGAKQPPSSNGSTAAIPDGGS